MYCSTHRGLFSGLSESSSTLETHPATHPGGSRHGTEPAGADRTRRDTAWGETPSSRYSCDPGIDFVRGMIPHHQAEISETIQSQETNIQWNQGNEGTWLGWRKKAMTSGGVSIQFLLSTPRVSFQISGCPTCAPCALYGVCEHRQNGETKVFFGVLGALRSS